MNQAINLLIVDDNPADSRRLVRLLGRISDWTIHTHECASSGEFKTALSTVKPDVVFVDYLLGAETGLDLVRSLPEETRQGCAFILLTGQGDEEVAAKALRAGVLDYMTKDGLSSEKLEHTLRFAVQQLADRRALHHRDEILQAVARVAELFLKATVWREKVAGALGILGRAANASRVYLFENFVDHGGELCSRQLFEWIAPGISPKIHNPLLQAFPWQATGCGHWANALKQGNIFQGGISAMSTTERAILEPQGIKALVLAPLFVDGTWWGLLGIDECREEKLWFEVELDALRTAANTLSAAIQREGMEQMMRLQATAIETAANAIFITDAEGVFLWANPAFSRITGYSTEEIQGNTPRILKSGRHDLAFYQDLWQTIKDGQVWRGEFVDRRKDGSLYIQEATISPVRDQHGQVTWFVAVQQDITLRKELEERLRAQAEFDALTGLPNRRLFEDRLIQSLALARRNQTHMVLMFVDLDHFKEVNDTLGHDAGDELLREAAKRLKECVRRSDTVARLGGDEFTVILPEVTHPNLAELVANKILEQLKRPFFPTSREARISGSVGIAIFPEDGHDVETLMKSADEAMYRSKKAGRATFRFFNPEGHQTSKES
ncbi:MAG: diguanylate cyclase [Magnetococcales bacterium]|nr:diguanylate cyclase [Magnetococcales bacterium]